MFYNVIIWDSMKALDKSIYINTHQGNSHGHSHGCDHGHGCGRGCRLDVLSKAFFQSSAIFKSKI